jgi:Gpi18-like mannosyltransferase
VYRSQPAEVLSKPAPASSPRLGQREIVDRLRAFQARHRLIIRALLLTLIWEMVAQIIGYVAAVTLPPSKDVAAFLLNHPAFHHKTYPLFETMWARWDGVWYVLIASQGYDPRVGILNAFFPAFPGLIHLVGGALGGNDLLAGILINRLLLFPTVGLFTQIVREESGDRAAEGAPLFFLLAPVAVFFLAVYTETLFLLACLACFLAMRHQRWWLAGACCAVATATRLPGIVLALALVVEGVASHKLWRALGAAALGLSGIAAYTLYLAALYGDPLAFQHAYNYGWGGRHFTLNIFAAPLQSILVMARDWPWQGAPALWEVSYVAALAIDCALLLVMWRSLRWSYRAFVVGSMLLPLLSGTLFAYNRYSLVLFPFLLVACRWTANRPALREAALLIMGCFSVMYLIFFTASYWVG